MSARDRARRVSLSAYEYLQTLWGTQAKLPKSKAIAISNQHKLERIRIVSRELLAEIPDLLAKLEPSSKQHSKLLEAKSTLDLIVKEINAIPAKQLGYTDRREPVTKHFWQAQEVVSDIRRALSK